MKWFVKLFKKTVIDLAIDFVESHRKTVVDEAKSIIKEAHNNSEDIANKLFDNVIEKLKAMKGNNKT